MSKRSFKTKTTHNDKSPKARSAANPPSKIGLEFANHAANALERLGKEQNRIVLTLSKATTLQTSVEDQNLTLVQQRIAKQSQELLNRFIADWERANELTNRLVEELRLAISKPGPFAPIRETSIRYGLLELEAATNALDCGSRELLANMKAFSRLSRS